MEFFYKCIKFTEEIVNTIIFSAANFKFLENESK